MTSAFQLSSEDAVDWLGDLAAGSVPLLILDPGRPGRARRAKKGEPQVPAFAETRLPALLHEARRVLARDRVCWWVTDPAYAFLAARVAERLGFAIGAPLVWDRGDGPGSRLGFALPLARGRARSPGAELVTAHRAADGDRRVDDATTLPELVCHALIEAASQPGEVVVDPFMGSGALGIAALALGRNYLGNDLVAPPPTLGAHLGRLGAADDDLRHHLGAVVSPAAADAHVARHGALGMSTTHQLTIFGDGLELR